MSPDDLQVAYNVKPLSDADIRGQGQRVAIVMASDLLDSDAAFFRSRFNLSPPNLRRFTLPGLPAPGIASDDIYGEVAGDYASVSAMAPGAEIDLVMPPNLTLVSIRTAEQYVINTLVPPVATESLAACESAFYSAAEQTLLRQSAAEGIAYFAAAGDDGVECPTPADSSHPGGYSVRPMVNCPACYDGVTAVGGTSYDGVILDSAGKLVAMVNERVWNDSPGVRFGCGATPLKPGTLTGASGGGVSSMVSMPEFQIDATGFDGGVIAG